MHTPPTHLGSVHMSRAALLTIALWIIAAAASPACAQEFQFTLSGDFPEVREFGRSVAVDNGIIAVEAEWQLADSSWVATAFLYDASDGTPRTQLLTSDGPTGYLDDNARSVVIDNGIVALGAQDAVYLFDAATGAQFTRLVAPDYPTYGQGFGNALDLDNGIIAIGAYQDGETAAGSGAVYLFDVTTGTLLHKLIAEDGQTQDRFGYSVAIDHGNVAIGAESANGFAGAAYLFDAATGAQLAELDSERPIIFGFGCSIAIDQGVVAVGAWYDEINRNGGTYLFDAATGESYASLLHSPREGEGELFGRAVAIKDDVIAVGAWNHYNKPVESGGVFLFDTPFGGQFIEFAPGGGNDTDYDRFGWSVALDTDILVTGAIGAGPQGRGEAHVFTTSAACDADVNGDGVLSPADFTAWIAAFNAGASGCDQNGDGSCTAGDFTAWIANYNAGC